MLPFIMTITTRRIAAQRASALAAMLAAAGIAGSAGAQAPAPQAAQQQQQPTPWPILLGFRTAALERSCS